jgi:H+/gluconate symporter and related permeases
MAIANELHADVGKVIIYGLILVVPGAIVGGPIFAKYISKRISVPLPNGAVASFIGKGGRELPSFGGTLLLTLLPLILMIGKTVVEFSSTKDAAYLPLVEFLGHPVIALFISAVASLIFLGVRRGFSSVELSGFCDKALLPMLKELDNVDPDDVIMSPARAKERGLTSTITFPVGNIAPEGSVIKSTAIDPSVIDADGVYRHTAAIKVFTAEPDAIKAIKAGEIEKGDMRANRAGRHWPFCTVATASL